MRLLPLARNRQVEADDTVRCLIRGNAPVAFGVSGGKDSCALAIRLKEYLVKAGHTGPRILIHSDLGSIEWEASLPTCRTLALYLDMELVVVRRKAGGMIERWESRWAANVERYCDLSCVKLILPWSSAAMRFCTAELKRDPICAALRKRWPGQNILSACGIRRDESTNRSTAPVSKEEPKLRQPRHGTTGYAWNAIAGWTKDDVFSYLEENAFPLHEGYTKYGVSRISCCFCILSSQADLRASAAVARHAAVYRRLVDLEIRSGFAFQPKKWLGDLAPHLLNAKQKEGLRWAKGTALDRDVLEATIPKHLLYAKGWPTCLPTRTEADLLADVRRKVGQAYALPVKYTTGRDVLDRYRELMHLKTTKGKL